MFCDFAQIDIVRTRKRIEEIIEISLFWFDDDMQTKKSSIIKAKKFDKTNYVGRTKRATKKQNTSAAIGSLTKVRRLVMSSHSAHDTNHIQKHTNNQIEQSPMNPIDVHEKNQNIKTKRTGLIKSKEMARSREHPS